MIGDTTMNTLPRSVTAHFFPDINSYNTLRAHWSMLLHSACKHDLAAEHHLLYCILLGKDWRRGFQVLSNQRKLANGAFYGWRLLRAIWALNHPSQEQRLLAPFEGIVSSTMLAQARKLIPTQTINRCVPADFVNGAFPFDAYLTIAL